MTCLDASSVYAWGHIFPVGLERGGEKKQTSMRKESLMQGRVIYSEDELKEKVRVAECPLA